MHRYNTDPSFPRSSNTQEGSRQLWQRDTQQHRQPTNNASASQPELGTRPTSASPFSGILAYPPLSRYEPSYPPPATLPPNYRQDPRLPPTATYSPVAGPSGIRARDDVASLEQEVDRLRRDLEQACAERDEALAAQSCFRRERDLARRDWREADRQVDVWRRRTAAANDEKERMLQYAREAENRETDLMNRFIVTDNELKRTRADMPDQGHVEEPPHAKRRLAPSTSHAASNDSSQASSSSDALRSSTSVADVHGSYHAFCVAFQCA